MNFMAIDNDPLCLDTLRQMLDTLLPACTCTCFTNHTAAWEHAHQHQLDAVFLDVELHGISGLTFAEQLKKLQPNLRIIFVTSHEKYAVSAFALHADGYLLKPLGLETLRQELMFLYGDNLSPPSIRVQTFGGFEIFVRGKPLIFRRAKSKELLACLIDRRGASLTTREACSLLWEDGIYNIQRKNYFQTVVHDLRRTLQNADIAFILVKSHNSIAIHPEALDCDSYHFLDGDTRAANSYRHNYLPSYSWAEFSVGRLEHL